MHFGQSAAIPQSLAEVQASTFGRTACVDPASCCGCRLAMIEAELQLIWGDMFAAGLK